MASSTLIPGALLAWWEEARRHLPWRDTRDPWAVLVSEVMLQQTQAARVIPKWHAFLERFPDPATCAAAPAGHVIEAWAGLGYNRRGLALHRCAQAVVAEHDGLLPADLGALLALPGIGPYTARAVLAFAFEQDVAVLDTHVARIVARQAGRRFTGREAQAAADDLVPAGEGWAWNQAVLDLGAMVCRSRSPRCPECPVAATCAWRGVGPDPAVGSAGVSTPQSRFEGSDRQGRGRLVDALRLGPVADVATASGWPDDPDRAARVAETLVVDGLAVRDGDLLRLP
ncbi:MAG TPA: A/G-specific adenine glycosylase [Acidimicrobiales bacterium]|nr:A/G-specific adenine glycosylase [Acidimicrobiales bacterium]